MRFHAAAPDEDFVDLGVHRPRAAGEAALPADALARLASAPERAQLMEYQPHAGRPAERLCIGTPRRPRRSNGLARLDSLLAAVLTAYLSLV